MNNMRRETALKIIALLRKEKGEGPTIREISKKLHIGYRPAYNHIMGLEKEEAIILKTVGKAKQSSLNMDSLKCRYLLQEVDLIRKEGLYNKNKTLKAVLENLIKKITNKFTAEIHSICLFGSYAKGMATKASDVDLFFMVGDLKKKSMREAVERECAGYQYSHNLNISPFITDIEEFKKMLKAQEMTIGKEVRDSGIALYGSEQFWRVIAWQE